MRGEPSEGRFGPFGGRFVPDTLFAALDTLEAVFRSVVPTVSFRREYRQLLSDFVGRPTPLRYAHRLSGDTGYHVWLKREDLCHTGAHKINNALGQALLAKRMGKERVIAETGAGQHGVATATACALLGLRCVIYMGEEDMARQSPNVFRMRYLGADVVPVTSGSRTLKDATTEAIRDWLKTVESSHYIIGSVVGPHPYPLMVRTFQSIIGREARRQLTKVAGHLPQYVVACVGGGSNAMGIFHSFVPFHSVALLAVEAGGHGLASGEHSASLCHGSPGVLHGALSYLLQDQDGQVALAHSVSAGLDYPGVGPELSYLKSIGRLTACAVTDDEALAASRWVSVSEGIIPALETSHAFAALRTYPFPSGAHILLNVSGRGDKDLGTLMNA
ncbi:tryptophan synthase subunit beta [bacterium]|nr:tryptophan synthase subunit beta [bacterium]